MSRAARLTGLVFGSLVLPLAVPRAQVSTQVTGTLSFVWGDPLDDSGRPRYVAFLADGTETIELNLRDASEELLARAMRLSGQRVMATLRPETGALPAIRGTVVGLLEELVAAPGSMPASAVPGTVGVAAFSPAPEWARVTRPYAILMCRFADIASEPRTPALLLDGYLGPIGSAESYFNEVSVGRISLAGSLVLGWFMLPEPRSGYVTNESPNLAKVAQHCLTAADNQVDFTQFGGVSINVNGSLGCCAWGGSALLQADGVQKVVPTIWMPNALLGGIVWHELGHSFGLPHSGGPYGRTYDSQWDVMSSSGGSMYFGPLLGSGGAHFNGYHKDRLGVIPRNRIVEVSAGSRSLVLEPTALAPDSDYPVHVVLPIAGRPGYGFTVEARWRRGYDRGVPRRAVLIHSIVPNRAEPAQVVDTDGNGNPNDAGASWTIGELYEDPGTGIRVVIDSITENGFGITVSNGSPAGPSLAAAGISLERDINNTDWYTDSVEVSGAEWSARRRFRSAWLRIDRASGIAGDFLTYAVRASNAPSGRNVDTLIVEDPGTKQRTAYTIEFGVTGVPELPRLSRPGAYRAHRPFFQLCDSIAIQLPPAFSGAAWTAMRTNRIQVAAGSSNCFVGASPQASGSGSTVLRFTHATSNLPGVLFVDSIRVTVSGFGDLFFVDSIESLPVPVLGLSRTGGRRDLARGELAPLDTMIVTNSSTVPGSTWFLFRRRNSTQLIRNTGRSGDPMIWGHFTTLGLGIAIDTIAACDTFTSSCSTSFFADTLVVTDVPSQLRVSRRSEVAQLPRGTAMRTDSAAVELLGTAASGRAWTASSNSLRISFHSFSAFTTVASGTGSGWLKWSYDVSRLGPGLYVDTIMVRADGVPGSPAMIVDSLRLETTRTVVGDVDLDGAILTGDAQAILRSLVGLPVPAGAVITPNGDANCDGTVSALDAMLIFQADLGIRPIGSCLGQDITVTASLRARSR
ncbi:MAG TPA: hypothetical protein VF981_13490 [Gemmatimonadaceae bacterium]